ncbi:MAG: shikimate dehydrogenase [Bacteroidetes bacterium]|nr:MAG: shikimate dehydrogenase [Bacteroidota bacterium]
MSLLYGLIGKKLGHSFSRRHFSEKFAREGTDARYELFELETIAQFPALLAAQPDLRGLNVTIPYKTQVIPFLDRCSAEAAAVGAVNTIRREQDGSLSGHNTDVYGFRISLEQFLAGEKPAAALVLGSGGAAKAVFYVLDQLGIPAKGVSRAAAEGVFTYESLRHTDLTQYPLIINTTPLGMYPDVEARPDLPMEQIGPAQRMFDLIYNPAETLLMREAREKGARVQNGLDMLILQAERAWEIWNQE